MNKNLDNFLLILMGVSFLIAGGTFINGIFMLIPGRIKGPMNLRIFIIAACFFISGKILLSVIERRKNTRGR